MKQIEHDKWMQLIQAMSDEEKLSLAENILGMLKPSSSAIARGDSCNDMIQRRLDGKPDCPHCQASAKDGFIVKRGFNKSVQRYFCKACGRVFVATTKTAFENTRKDAGVWRKFIMATLDGHSIQKCARECKLSYQTAFTWRHKMLNAFRIHQESMQISGRIEMDEMLIPLSYKGNHIKGHFSEPRVLGPGVDNGLPRDSMKRGSDNRSTYARDRACVLCMVADSGRLYYGAVPGVGFMQQDMLDATVQKHVDKQNALMLVDHYAITAKYLQDNGYRHIKLLSNVLRDSRGHKPEILGDLHLQHVNAVHHRIRRFLSKYCGVSSKYLGNYIAFFMWLENLHAAKQGKKAEKASIGRLSSPGSYVTRMALHALPAVPKCA